MMAAQLQQPAPIAPVAGGLNSIQGQQAAPAVTSAPSPAQPSETEAKSEPLRNRAAESSSPYVRAQALAPVTWQLMDDETIARAKRENKPIFLNVGFFSCHYCRLTGQDSFHHPAIAELLNTSFIPIILDREERPDIDAVYMNYVQAIHGAGGWPLNVFLTPELEPIFGGTYWPGPGTEHSNSTMGPVVRRGGAAGRGGPSGVDGEDDDRLDFLVILRKIQKTWAEQETRCRKEAKEILVQLREFAAEGTLGTRGTGEDNAAVLPEMARSAPQGPTVAASGAGDLEVDLDQLEEAYTHIEGTYDAVNGGFGVAPKFPTPARLSFLLRLSQYPASVRHVVGDREVAHAAEMATETLRRIRDGGLHDHVGGGFSRYSVTADWAMPHFEKTLPDNALLLNVYLDAWLTRSKAGGVLSKEDEFADVVLELGDYLTSPPISLESGGFVASVAADSYYRRGDRHMREGAYYLWTRREFDTVVGGGKDGQHASSVAAAHWNVLEDGNVPRDQDPHDEFINQNVLRVVKDMAELSRQFGIPVEEARRLVVSAKEKLLTHRKLERVPPAVDEKVVASFNGAAIAALARTAAAVRYVDGERSQKYLKEVENAARFIKGKLWDPETRTLYRSYWGRRGETKGFAEDYAFMVEGLLELFEVTREQDWLEWADELQKTQIDLFYDHETGTSSPPASRHSCGAFYSTAAPDAQVILHLKDGMDTAQPSTNAVSTSNLFRLSGLLGDPEYGQLACETINAFEVEILQYPWLFIGLLSGVVSARLGGRNWLIVGDGEDATATGNGGEKSAEGIGMADAQDLLRQYHTSPRAAVRTVLFAKSPAEENSWLLRRNPALQTLIADSKVASGTYLLENGKFRPSTQADLKTGEGETAES